MPVSKAVVPILENDVARSFLAQLKRSRIQPYSDDERCATEAKITEILKKKRQRPPKQ